MESEVKKVEGLPLVSVVMITYNHEDYIEESLMSVLNQKNENFNFEILIVDDGSNDNTQKIITKVQEEYPDILFPTFKEHVGVSAINRNVNEQIKKARGDFIAFLSGDDSFVNDSLSKQLSAFKDNEKIDVVIAEGRNFSVKNNEYLDTCQEDKIVKMLINEEIENIYKYIISNVPRLFVQGFMVKKRLLKDINYFDEDLIADDWVLNIRIFKYLSENKRLAKYIKDEVFKRNIHEKNTSKDHKVHYKRIYQVILKYVPKENQKNMLKELYFRYFVIYLKEKNIPYSLLFFAKYITKDIMLIDLQKKLLKKLIK